MSDAGECGSSNDSNPMPRCSSSMRMAMTSLHSGRRIANERTARMSCDETMGSRWARGSESGALMRFSTVPPVVSASKSQVTNGGRSAENLQRGCYSNENCNYTNNHRHYIFGPSWNAPMCWSEHEHATDCPCNRATEVSTN